MKNIYSRKTKAKILQHLHALKLYLAQTFSEAIQTSRFLKKRQWVRFHLLILLFLFHVSLVSAQEAFITTWKTDNTGTSDDNQITIPTTGSGYDYSVDWGDGNSDTGVTGSITHTYASAGTYTVSISGDFPRIFFQNGGDKDKLITIEQWGDIEWTSMSDAFFGCSNMDVVATDAPDLSGVTSLYRMFGFATSFNGDISHWDVSTITNMEVVFAAADIFNQDISDWDVSNVTSFHLMFDDADAFNQDISEWDVSSATAMSFMFRNAKTFNQPLDAWDVSNVTTMREMFRGALAFNQPLATWDVSNVTTMEAMFFNAPSFNQPLNSWNVSNVTSIYNMFRAAGSFNQDLDSWDVSSVTDARSVFYGAASFNGDISTWDVTGFTDFTSFLSQATSFNQDITGWDVSGATTMASMFNLASAFNQDLSGWDVSNVTDMNNMFVSTSLTKYNYDKTLIGWSQLTLQNDVSFRTSQRYCNGAGARQSIIDTFNWTFTDGGESCNAFITTWETTTADEVITIPTTGTGYDFYIDWGDGNTNTAVDESIGHTYSTPGEYTISITGDFPRIYFNNAGDKDKILTVEQWGDIIWTSMEFAFAGCQNLQITASDAPNLSQVTTLRYMFNNAKSLSSDLNNWDVSTITNMFAVFYGANAFNGNISDWDVSNVTNMQALFGSAYAFNQDISGWDVSSVTQMKDVFFRAFAFNQDLSNWDVSSAISTRDMFNGATAFDQDLSAWDVSNVTNMIGMFSGATSFDQDLSSWDVANVTDMTNMLNSTALSQVNYDRLLSGWSQLTLQNDVVFGASGVAYCQGATDRQSIIDTYNWTITDEGENCVINFPDANFEAALLANTSINTVDDGEITVQEAEAFTGTLVIDNLSIADLTGINYFVNLSGLQCNTNELTSLDLSHNHKLKTLQAYNNSLTFLDVSGATLMTSLNVTNSSLETIDLSDQTALTTIYLNGNPLSSVDFSANTALQVLSIQNIGLSELDLTNNTSLNWLYAQGNNLTSLDLSNNTALTILFLGVNSLTSLDVSNNTALTDLRVMDNELTSLDISANTSLEKFYANDNLLTDLNAANGANETITTFNILNNPSLSCVKVDHPALARANWTDVDDPAIFKLSCDPDEFVYIPDANFKAALLANAEINTIDDGEITTGEAESFSGSITAPSASISSLEGIEYFPNIIGVTFSSNSLTTADFSNNTKLENIFVNNNAISSLNISQCPNLLDLRAYNNAGLSSVDVSENPLLTRFWAANCSLTELDLSNNPELEDIWLSGGNSFSTVDLSNNPKITKLLMVDNDLTSLDLTQNTALVDLRVSNNNLTSLNLRNGSNELITNFEAGTNVSLNCISVDNPAYSRANWSNVDDADYFKFTCDPDDIVNIPDANLKAALVAGSIDANDDDEISYGEAEAYTADLTLDNLGILDLTGLQAFTQIDRLEVQGNDLTEIKLENNAALTYLDLSDNEVSSLDVSALTLLTDLRLARNSVTTLDVSSNTSLDRLFVQQIPELTDLDLTDLASLRYLNMSGTGISTVDLSQNTSLVSFEMTGVEMSTIDLSANTDLQILNLSANSLTSIDLSANTALTLLWLANNDLSTLDLSGQPAINNLILSNNQLTGLNVANGNNANFTRFELTGNANLTCITVDDVDYAIANFTEIDEQTNFDLDCYSTTQILTFELEDQTGPATIDADNKTITIEVPFGTVVSSLTPTIALLNNNGSVSPESAQDFSSPVVYTVLAEDGSTTGEWTAIVTFAPNTANDILTFVLEQQSQNATIDTEDHSVTIIVTSSTDVTSLSPEITLSENATVSPASGEAADFTDPVIYTVTSESGSSQEWEVSVIPMQVQTISFTNPGTLTYGDEAFTLEYSSSSGLTTSVEINNGLEIVSLEGDVLSILTAGTFSLRFAQEGSELYDPVELEVELEVGQALMTVIAQDQSMVYGESIPTLTGTLAGVVNDDNITAAYTTAYDGNRVGDYSVEVSLIDPENRLPNYEVTNTSGLLTVSKAALNIVADDKRIIYGDDIPTLTGTLTGVISGDDITVGYSTNADNTSDAGAYAIDAELSDPNDKLVNYDVSKTNATLTIEKASQIITFDEIPDLDLANSQHVNLMATASSGLDVTYSLTAGDGSIAFDVLTLNAAGTFTVTAAQSGNTNYSAASPIARSFTVTDTRKQTQTITFGAIDDQIYGNVITLSASASSGLDVSYELLAGEGSFESGILTIKGVGNYTIRVSQPGNESFEATSKDQSFAVSKAPLTITAEDITINQGESIPTLTFGLEGLLFDDSVGDLDTEPEISTDATPSSDPGTYAINLSGGEDDHYDFILVDGTLTIEAVLGVSHLQQVNVYPNPTSAYVTITTVRGETVMITDLEGRTVLREENTDAVMTLDVSGWNRGVYLVHFMRSGKSQSMRLLIQ
jgi:surface protein